MRFLALPNGIEHQVVRHLRWNDSVARMLLDADNRLRESQITNGFQPDGFQPDAVTIRVAVNQDGSYMNTDADSLGIAPHIRNLFKEWGDRILKRTVQVQLETVTLLHFDSVTGHESARERNLDRIRAADIFYCCGGFTRYRTKEDYIGLCDEMNLHVLRERTQYDLMAYIGVCAGAMLASNALLGVVPSAHIVYDANVSPGDCHFRSNLSAPSGDVMLQMTTGCGFSIDIWHTRSTKLLSFPVVKNSRQWEDFAERNTIRLQEAGRQLEMASYEYDSGSNGISWWFRISGDISLSSGRMAKVYRSLDTECGYRVHYVQDQDQFFLLKTCPPTPKMNPGHRTVFKISPTATRTQTQDQRLESAKQWAMHKVCHLKETFPAGMAIGQSGGTLARHAAIADRPGSAPQPLRPLALPAPAQRPPAGPSSFSSSAQRPSAGPTLPLEPPAGRVHGGGYSWASSCHSSRSSGGTGGSPSSAAAPKGIAAASTGYDSRSGPSDAEAWQRSANNPAMNPVSWPSPPGLLGLRPIVRPHSGPRVSSFPQAAGTAQRKAEVSEAARQKSIQDAMGPPRAAMKEREQAAREDSEFGDADGYKEAEVEQKNKEAEDENKKAVRENRFRKRAAAEEEVRKKCAELQAKAEEEEKKKGEAAQAALDHLGEGFEAESKSEEKIQKKLGKYQGAADAAEDEIEKMRAQEAEASAAEAEAYFAAKAAELAKVEEAKKAQAEAEKKAKAEEEKQAKAEEERKAKAAEDEKNAKDWEVATQAREEEERKREAEAEEEKRKAAEVEKAERQAEAAEKQARAEAAPEAMKEGGAPQDEEARPKQQTKDEGGAPQSPGAASSPRSPNGLPRSLSTSSRSRSPRHPGLSAGEPRCWPSAGMSGNKRKLVGMVSMCTEEHMRVKYKQCPGPGVVWRWVLRRNYGMVAGVVW